MTRGKRGGAKHDSRREGAELSETKSRLRFHFGRIRAAAQPHKLLPASCSTPESRR